MKIQIMSDLHLEHHRDQGTMFLQELVCSEGAGDILILAGDIDNHKDIYETLRALETCAAWNHIIYVPGNHEYYTSNFQAMDALLKQADEKFETLHVLNDGVVEIEGQRFVGSTMWFRDSEQVMRNRHCLNDFNYIFNFRNEFADRNSKAMRFLHDNVRKDDIVITHHVPTEEFGCINEYYKGNRLNCFFVCDMLDLIVEVEPKAWIYGHTHECAHNVIGETRMICNTMGYPHEGQGEFNINLTMEA